MWEVYEKKDGKEFVIAVCRYKSNAENISRYHCISKVRKSKFNLDVIEIKTLAQLREHFAKKIAEIENDELQNHGD